MAQTTFRGPDELLDAIDRARAQEAAESGNIKSRSEWLREAAREKLGVEGYDTDLAESEKGAA